MDADDSVEYALIISDLPAYGQPSRHSVQQTADVANLLGMVARGDWIL